MAPKLVLLKLENLPIESEKVVALLLLCQSLHLFWYLHSRPRFCYAYLEQQQKQAVHQSNASVVLDPAQINHGAISTPLASLFVVGRAISIIYEIYHLRRSRFARRVVGIRRIIRTIHDDMLGNITDIDHDGVWYRCLIWLHAILLEEPPLQMLVQHPNRIGGKRIANLLLDRSPGTLEPMITRETLQRSKLTQRKIAAAVVVNEIGAASGECAGQTVRVVGAAARPESLHSVEVMKIFTTSDAVQDLADGFKRPQTTTTRFGMRGFGKGRKLLPGCRGDHDESLAVLGATPGAQPHDLPPD